LCINHIEIRTEQSIDVAQYTNSRNIEVVTVELCKELADVRLQFQQVMGFYLGRLIEMKACYLDVTRLSPYALINAREQYRAKAAAAGISGPVENYFFVLITLAHCNEVLVKYGLEPFLKALHERMESGTNPRLMSELNGNAALVRLYESVKEQVGALGTDSEQGPDEDSVGGNAVPKKFSEGVGRSHPKLKALEELVLKHFKTCPHPDTRIMVFSQYRTSVENIAAVLDAHKPLVKAQCFIGQSNNASGRGLKQKDQIDVVKKFRDGVYNALVATSVGEEGLDIGDVDLIVCFDAHTSSTRLVQRMGRTGRKRQGKIVMLLTEGREVETYKRSQAIKSKVQRLILNGANNFRLYPDNPRMIPLICKPQVERIQVAAKPTFHVPRGRIKKRRSAAVDGLTEEELREYQERFEMDDEEDGDPLEDYDISRWSSQQSYPCAVHAVHHSKATMNLIVIMS
jgi:Fanconi anemia group M protein